MPHVRDATVGDLPAIVDLHNALIPTTTITWTEELETLEHMREWFVARQSRGFPVLVAEHEATGAVIGYCTYGDFRDTVKWPGYRFTVENTVHVRSDHHGTGVGRALMEALLDRARAAGLHVMVAAVDGENEGSIRFHEALGFVEVGRFREAGRKFDRWLDVVFLQRTL